MAVSGVDYLATAACRRWRYSCDDVSCSGIAEQRLPRFYPVRIDADLDRDTVLNSNRTALFWTNGAVVYMTQVAGGTIADTLSGYTTTVSCIIGILLVLLSYTAIARCERYPTWPMLCLRNEDDEDIEEPGSFLMRFVPVRYRDVQQKSWTVLALNANLLMTAGTMCLAGVGKAAKPFFGAYVTHRYGFSPSQVSKGAPQVRVFILTSLFSG